MNDPQFLRWVSDRLVFQHGESPNVDFVLKLRSMADAHDAQFAELRRLRDEAREAAAPETPGCGDWALSAGHGDGIETAARLLGRELPEWKPGKEGR